MKSRKFHYYLLSLSDKEILGFKNWLDSPLHNSRPSLVKLFEHYLSVVLRSKEEVSVETFHESYWGDKPFDDLYLRRAMATLLKQLLGYIAFLGYQKDSSERDGFLLQELNRRKLLKYFEIEHKKSQSQLLRTKKEGDDLFRHQYNQAKEHANFLILSGKSTRKKVYAPPLQKALSWFLFTNLKYTSAAINRAKIYNLDHHFLLLRPLVDFLLESELRQAPLIQIYLNIYLTLQGEQDKVAFGKLEQLMAHYEDQFSKEEVQSIYIFAINYIRRQIKQGKPMQSELVAWYRRKLDAGVLMINGKLPLVQYKNICIEMLRVKRYQEAEKMILDYKYQLFNDPKGHTALLCEAYLRVGLGDYLQAKELLLEFISLAPKLKAILLLLAARKLICQVWFELAKTDENAYDILECEIHAFNSFVKRKNILAPAKQAEALRFGRGMQSLFRWWSATEATQQKNLNKVEAKIASLSRLEDREWFELQVTQRQQPND